MLRLVALLVLFAGGCVSRQPSGQKWQGESVPLPVSTPFDANQFARLAYLEGFRAGYHAQWNRGNGVELLTGPYGQARELGFHAGAAEARAEMGNSHQQAPPATLEKTH